jgi:hypothetical protein
MTAPADQHRLASKEGSKWTDVLRVVEKKMLTKQSPK